MEFKIYSKKKNQRILSPLVKDKEEEPVRGGVSKFSENLFEVKERSFKKLITKEIDSDDDSPIQERPKTTGGRIFGIISEDLHNKIQNSKNMKMSNIDLPSS